jgi:hypothetical protein
MNEKILKDFPSIHQVRYRGATVASPVLAISIAELQQAARVPTSRCPYPWLQCCCYMQTRVHDRQPTTHELDYVRAQRILPKPYNFDEWIAIAKDRSKWRQLTHSIPKPPDA